MTDAERQRRRRDRLREQRTSLGDGRDPLDSGGDYLKLTAALRERDAALERCRQLEAELKRARADERSYPAPDAREISVPLYRWLRAKLHPDRTTDPSVKKYLEGAFIELTKRVETKGQITLEEMAQRRAAKSQKNRERAQRAAATRKTNAEAKAATQDFGKRQS